MKKRSEVEVEGNLQANCQGSKNTGCADCRARVPSHWDGRVHCQHMATRLRVALQFALQTRAPGGSTPCVFVAIGDRSSLFMNNAGSVRILHEYGAYDG